MNSNKMKAVVCSKYGPPDVLQLKELDKPGPKDNEVLIKIFATVVEPSDCGYRSGKPFFGRLFSGLLKPKNPVLGFELAGEIEAIGKSVRRFKVGDDVYGATGIDCGAYAEYKCLAQNGTLAIKPTNFNFEEAAGICDGALTALPFLRDKGNIQSGQKVLINGASGSVGIYAIQIASYYGAEVTGVCSSSNIELVKSMGADNVIDYTQEDFTQDGQTYDIIFDAVAKSSFAQCKNSLKQKGVYLSTMPSLALLFQMLWTSKIGNKKAMFAASGMRPAKDRTEDLIFLKELIEAGIIKSVIDRRYPMEQIAEAHTYVEKGHKKGNVVITIVNN